MPSPTLTGHLLDPQNNTFVEEYITAQEMLNKYGDPLPSHLYITDFGGVDLPNTADWRLPISIFGGPLVANALVNQPMGWGYRMGNRGSGITAHADEWGYTWSTICNFHGRKRILLFKDPVPDDEERLFPPQLGAEDFRMFTRLGGCKLIVLNPGQVLVFQPKYFHAVTNLAANTLSTQACLITYDTLDMGLKDVQHMPSQNNRNLVWFGSYILALQQELELYNEVKHISLPKVKALVQTIRDMMQEARDNKGVKIKEVRKRFSFLSSKGPD